MDMRTASTETYPSNPVLDDGLDEEVKVLPGTIAHTT